MMIMFIIMFVMMMMMMATQGLTLEFSDFFNFGVDVDDEDADVQCI